MSEEAPTLRNLFWQDFRISLPELPHSRDIAIRCPWHADSGTSLIVNPVRNTYRCTGCEMRGDSESYLVFQRGMSLGKAKELIAHNSMRPNRKESRPGASALAYMRKRMREDACELVGQILSAPISDESMVPLYDALLPGAPDYLRKALVHIGIRVDFVKRVFWVSPTHPGLRKLASRIGKPDLNIREVLMVALGAKDKGIKRLFQKKNRRVLEIPFRGMGLEETDTCLFCGGPLPTESDSAAPASEPAPSSA